MKKILMIMLVAMLSVAMLAIFSLTGCKTTTTETTAAAATTAAETTAAAATTAAETTAAVTTAAAKGKKVGILFPTTVVNRFVLEADLIEKGLTKLGYKVVGNQFAQDDANKQIEQSQNMLSDGADLLIVCPVDKTSSQQIVVNAHAENVPVISYVRMVGGDVDYYVSEDNEAVGTLQGKFMASTLQKGNIIILTGDTLDNNAHLYRDTALAEIQPLIDKGDIKVVADQFCKGWQPSEAQKHVENALTQNNNDIQGILCTNDGTAGGAIEALAAQKLDGKVIVTGGDCELAAAKRIWKGTQAMSVLKEMYKISAACIETADTILKGEKPITTEVRNNETKDVPSVLVPMIVVTKDNFKEVLIDSGYFKLEELGIKPEELK